MELSKIIEGLETSELEGTEGESTEITSTAPRPGQTAFETNTKEAEKEKKDSGGMIDEPDKKKKPVTLDKIKKSLEIVDPDMFEKEWDNALEAYGDIEGQLSNEEKNGFNLVKRKATKKAGKESLEILKIVKNAKDLDQMKLLLKPYMKI